MSADQIIDIAECSLRDGFDLSDREIRELLDTAISLRAEVQRLTEEARRSDAGRVEVPELTSDDLRSLIEWVYGDRINVTMTAPKITAWFRSRLSPSPQPATGADLESLIHAVAMAAWDHGAECGIVWCPDADMTKRGVVPMTQEEGLKHSRNHFAEHGDGSPIGPFNAALHALRDALRPSPQSSADVVVDPWAAFEEARRKAVIYRAQGGRSASDIARLLRFDSEQVAQVINALRSSTNHDAQDAGEGR